ncbi:tetratricopeptide repeat protein [Streptomyces sp. NPDC002078]
MDEVFFSYARADRAGAMPVVEALRRAGLRVFLDETGIDEFQGITPRIRSALAGARLFVAYYSVTYPTRPACQWELLTAFRAATALGHAADRILVINPESGPDHIQPVSLRDSRYATTDDDAVSRLVRHITRRVTAGSVRLGDAIEEERPTWRPTEHLGSDRFVGRVKEFWQLHSALHALEYPATHDGTGAGQAVVVGLGGVGKTLLAEQYARRFGCFYPGGVYWFTAAASHTAHPSVGSVLPEEVLAQHHQQVAGIFDVDPHQRNPQQIREAARRRIQEIGKLCLWVVDDIPGELPPEVVRELAAPHPLGRTVLTTRWRGYHLPAVDIDVLHPDEAYRLLTSARTPVDLADEQAARTLTRNVGFHALAVDLARGCLADQPGLSYPELLKELLDTQHGDGFQRLVDDLYLQVPSGHTNDIAATFTRSLNHLDEQAVTILRISATLAPASLPERLLTAVTATLHDSDEQSARRTVRRALSAAQRRSLIRQTGTNPPAWFVHALVSRTLTLQPDAALTHPSIRVAALTATNELMRPVYTPGRLQLADIAPHARALTEDLDGPQALALLRSVARYDLETGQAAAAAGHYERLTQVLTTGLHGDHPDVLTVRNDLAIAYQAAGNLRRAIPLFEQNLTDTERIFGRDHPSTLTSRNNLAHAYEVAGNLQRAVPLFEQNLTDTERIFGRDHPNTLTSCNNLAIAYHSRGDRRQAIALWEQTLADRERVLGDDHPDTLNSRNSLATAYEAAEDLRRAIPLWERTLAGCERVLGNDHPDTLFVRNNLAYAYHVAGDLRRAIPLHEQAVADCERVLGRDHPTTLTSRSYLANAYNMAGDLRKAIILHEQDLTDRDRVLGPDHPQTLTSRNNLASTYLLLGDLERAIPMLEQSLADHERLLGHDHAGTLSSCNNLASAYSSAGDLRRAIRLWKRALAGCERVFGPDHPKTRWLREQLRDARSADRRRR